MRNARSASRSAELPPPDGPVKTRTCAVAGAATARDTRSTNEVRLFIRSPGFGSPNLMVEVTNTVRTEGAEPPRGQGARLRHSRAYGAGSATMPAGMDRRPNATVFANSPI